MTSQRTTGRPTTALAWRSTSPSSPRNTTALNMSSIGNPMHIWVSCGGRTVEFAPPCSAVKRTIAWAHDDSSWVPLTPVRRPVVVRRRDEGLHVHPAGDCRVHQCGHPRPRPRDRVMADLLLE